MRVDHPPETIDFPLATLDDLSAISPRFHIWMESRISWFKVRDTWPRHRECRPDTPGST